MTHTHTQTHSPYLTGTVKRTWTSHVHTYIHTLFLDIHKCVRVKDTYTQNRHSMYTPTQHIDTHTHAYTHMYVWLKKY